LSLDKKNQKKLGKRRQSGRIEERNKKVMDYDEEDKEVNKQLKNQYENNWENEKSTI